MTRFFRGLLTTMNMWHARAQAVGTRFAVSVHSMGLGAENSYRRMKVETFRYTIHGSQKLKHGRALYCEGCWSDPFRPLPRRNGQDADTPSNSSTERGRCPF